MYIDFVGATAISRPVCPGGPRAWMIPSADLLFGQPSRDRRLLKAAGWRYSAQHRAWVCPSGQNPQRAAAT